VEGKREHGWVQTRVTDVVVVVGPSLGARFIYHLRTARTAHPQDLADFPSLISRDQLD
jgi:hypothetical protein